MVIKSLLTGWLDQKTGEPSPYPVRFCIWSSYYIGPCESQVEQHGFLVNEITGQVKNWVGQVVFRILEKSKFKLCLSIEPTLNTLHG